MIQTALLALAAFVSTNIDDAALLLGLTARGEPRPSAILAGQLLAMAMLTGASALVASLAFTIPAAALRLLGLMPMMIGAHALWRGDDPAGASVRAEQKPTGVLTVAALTIASGGDNIAVTVPLMAGRPAAAIVTVGLVYAAMTVAWCGMACRLGAHPRVGALARRWAAVAFPYGLIALGLAILAGR